MMKTIFTIVLTTGLLMLNSDALAQGLKQFEDALKISYTFSYPEQFQVQRQIDGSVLIISPLSSAEDTFRETLTISLSKSLYNISLDSMASITKARMIQFVKSNVGPVKVMMESIKIGGIDGRKVSMSGISNQKVMTISVSFAAFNGALIQLSYMNEFQLESNEIVSFGKLIESIKIK
jgi:hypothetical protein